MSAEEKINILLVDDQPNNLILLEDILQSPEYHLVKAYSGKEALRHILKINFAVILLDIMMPDLNGFETARLIRQRRQSRQIPIIFITALDQDQATGHSLGVIDYLSKPFDIDILKSKVSGFVDLYKRAQQAEQERKARADAEAA
ncbi:MAG: response regulator [Nitrospirae bacterium]|nr:response regulator [Candidatus Manganitrophaceae bacterium]